MLVALSLEGWLFHLWSLVLQQTLDTHLLHFFLTRLYWYLAVSLRGQAQGVLGNLPLESRQDFKELVKSLEERFSPSNQTELYRTQLRERRQRAVETLPELGQDVRRLANLAYPTAPNDVRETLAKEQFIDSLIDGDMRLRIKQARPINLNDAIVGLSMLVALSLKGWLFHLWSLVLQQTLGTHLLHFFLARLY
jgi:hypothetical protein